MSRPFTSKEKKRDACRSSWYVSTDYWSVSASSILGYGYDISSDIYRYEIPGMIHDAPTARQLAPEDKIYPHLEIPTLMCENHAPRHIVSKTNRQWWQLAERVTQRTSSNMHYGHQVCVRRSMDIQRVADACYMHAIHALRQGTR